MDELEKYVNADDEQFDPLVRCFLVHYQFEAIHPFADSNGRVGRALLALMIYKWLGHSLPWLYMSAYYEQYRDEYIAGLFDISTKGQWSKWIEFCLRGVVVQATDSIRRCRKFNDLRAEYHKRVDTPTPRTHGQIESLFRSPLVTIPSISQQCNVSYHTAQTDIERLASVEILHELPEVYPRTFVAIEIMKISYEPTGGDTYFPPIQ